ncbi:MAG: hypothetical protein Fur009_4810 [Candidatus Microgenomates bacterium]
MLPHQSSRKFLHKFLFLIEFIFLVGIFIIIFFLINDFLKIKEIKLIDVDNKKIIGIEELKNNYLIFLNEDQIKSQLLKKNPEIKDIQFEKYYPNTLILRIFMDKPVAILPVDNGYFYLTYEGKIFSKSKKINEKTTIINFYQKLISNNYYPGENIQLKEIILALKILKKMSDLNVNVNSLDINGIGVIVFNLKDKKIYFSSEKNIENQFYQFESIYRQFKIEGRNYREIDLQFDKPIVRF